MSTIVLKAKSSSGEPYDVEFNISDSIIVRCNCKAGIFGKLCKHKTALLAGEDGILWDPRQKPVLGDLHERIMQSEYVGLEYQALMAKQAVDAAKRQEKKARQAIEHALKEGIRLTTEN